MTTSVIIDGETWVVPDDFRSKRYAANWEAFWTAVCRQQDTLLGFGALSASSVTVGSGSKTFTLAGAARRFAAGSIVRADRVGAAETFMVGEVVSHEGATLTLAVPEGFTGGAGTHADWLLRHASSGLNTPLPVAQGGTGRAALIAEVSNLLGAANAAAMRTALGVGQAHGDGSVAAPSIAFAADADTGVRRRADDRLAFVTGGVDRLDVSASGDVGVGRDSSPTVRLFVEQTAQGSGGSGANAIRILASHVSYSGTILMADTVRPASTAFDFLRCQSDTGGVNDAEARIRGDGQIFSDAGTTVSQPADHALMMEWADGNPTAEDRVGLSVVAVFEPGRTRMIRQAEIGERPLGVVAGAPALLTGAAWNHWAGKYERDAFNRPVYETVERVRWQDAAPGRPTAWHDYWSDRLPGGISPPPDAQRFAERRRKLNPTFDPVAAYRPRGERAEWAPIGLKGVLRLRKGQPVDERWVKLGDVAEDVEEWLLL